jgi:hypothetical protein
MTTFADSCSLSDDTLDAEQRLAINLGRGRKFVREMMEDGAYGVELVYAMTFVAVEAGLTQTNNGFYIFPRIAEAIADAGFDAKAKSEEAAEEEAALVEDPSSNILPLTRPINVGDRK